MGWRLTDDVEEFLDEAGGFLAAHPAENSVLLTVTDAVRGRGPQAFGGGRPRYGWWRPGPGEEVAGACLRTPPLPLVLGRMPAAAAAGLAAALAACDGDLPGAGGDRPAAEAFAAAWRDATGAAVSVRREEILHRLAALAAPDPAPSGAAREARPDDRDLVVGWFEEFSRETGERLRDFTADVEARIARGGVVLWEDAGRPGSMACVSAEAAGTVRIGPVHTPPGLRRRGYAAGATHAVAARALAQGVREVLLITDLANPTSNALYRRLGFRPVADRLVLAFGPGEA
ncbi:GNAT family N-acetyltransferase [Streptacidiphilus sp. ASG 303]|uniref:GNAT family N-acetyltransferase n=1 Tax=Streptacidiphilus sp. ASG 303 TaxID=2896847 RepID=UPI001E500744|nr:GNAT family N-acetyltransferase [Streptacidiphilus sp. ASG 303]MCD0485768.1 GNAT family N-acetyltransferase [Streptacidiphilus sp. ASG 303]